MEKNICLLGANGQVGFETCLHLRKRMEYSVIPVTRTSYGASILNRVGFVTTVEKQTQSSELRSIFEKARVVVDFGWPKGAVSRSAEIRQRIREHLSYCSKETAYVFISTQSVHHLDPEGPKDTEYSLTKKAAERFALKEGKRQGKKVFILRLGEVHGAFQRISKSIVYNFNQQDVVVPDLASHTVFTYSIAEALANIASGREKPGTYLLYSKPRWSWVEVHDYYSKWTSIASSATPVQVVNKAQNVFQRASGKIKEFVMEEAFRNKDLMEYRLSGRMPDFFQKTRLRLYKKRSGAEVAAYLSSQRPYPYIQKVEVRGPELESLTDVRETILKANREVEAEVHQLIGLA